MSFGASGGASGSTSTSTSTTPWTTIATQLAPLLGQQLSALGSGSSITQGIQALTASSNLQTQQGIANIKEAEGASGARYGSSVANSISQFQTQQTTALNTQIAEFQQGAVQNQLAALSEIISLASGSGTTKGSQTGWNFASGFGIGPGTSVGTSVIV
jgi:hypothetical protein